MEVSVLKDIVIIFALSTMVNLLFNKLKIPTVIGYLITGFVAGPHLLGLISAQHDIELMAEIGVVLLMFTIGMEFSLKHLLKIRRIVFFGGFIQVTLTAGGFFAASFLYGISWQGGLFIGFLSALSSSALVLKILQQRSEITSNYGRTVVGILIFQDILLVPLILFTRVIGHDNVDIAGQLADLAIKAVLIIVFVYVGNKWILPKVLHTIALAKNQELFLMSIFLICLGIAFITYEMGLTLALGAFLAGLMISESEYSHNAFGNLIPFRDMFTSFFFVSIGMLLDMHFVTDNYALVILSVLLIIIVKAIFAGGTGFLLGHTFRGTVMVGLALSQVGEFSFVLAKIGLDSEIIPDFFYKLFIAVAVITMSVTPFLIQLAKPLATTLLKLPLPKLLITGLFPLPEIEIPDVDNHVVIIGKDASALKLSSMITYSGMKYISIIFDPALVRERQKKGETVVYGDAVNEPILYKAQMDKAAIAVVSVGDMIASMAITEKIRRINKNVYIIVRAKHFNDIEHLYKLGADQVVPEKLEIAIDLFSRILTRKYHTRGDINRTISKVRNDYYGHFRERDVNNQPSIMDELAEMELSALDIHESSWVIGKSLANIQLRTSTGVTLLAMKRDKSITEHPRPDFVFMPKDVIYIIGNPEQISYAVEYISKEK